VNVIIGHPDERWSDLVRSGRFLVRTGLAGADTAAAIMFGAYPGSKDFERLHRSGQLVVDEAALYAGISRGSGAHRSYNPRMTPRQMRWAQLAMMLVFYGVGLVRHPGRIVERVRAQWTGNEETHFDQLVRIKRQGRRAARAARRGRSVPVVSDAA
jgi:hypothetical protein